MQASRSASGSRKVIETVNRQLRIAEYLGKTFEASFSPRRISWEEE